MKKWILILLLLMPSIYMEAQTYRKTSIYKEETRQKYVPHPSEIATINITQRQVQNGWALHGNACAGCASYWYQILRSAGPIQAEDGISYYYYYFNFYSNSYYNNGLKASTYLSNLGFYLNGIKIFDLNYILISPDIVVWGAWMRSVNVNTIPSFTITNVNVQ